MHLSNWIGQNSPGDGGGFCLKKLHWTHGNIQDAKRKTMKNLNVIFNGIAVAMGIAIIVLNIVNPLSLTSATTLLGIGIAALGVANLRRAS
jgi:hypothetical protein